MKKGFTLTEFFIAAGIITVVSIIISLVFYKDYYQKYNVEILKRTSGQISNAAGMYLEDLTKADLSKDFNQDKFLTKYFDNSKICKDKWENCLASQYTSIDDKSTYKTESFIKNILKNKSKNNEYYNFKCATLDIGSVVCIGDMRPNTYHNNKIVKHGYATILVDTNSKLLPNKKGRDFYSFYLYSDGTVAETYNKGSDKYGTAKYQGLRNRCGSNLNGYADSCYNKIVEDGWYMDY